MITWTAAMASSAFFTFYLFFFSVSLVRLPHHGKKNGYIYSFFLPSKTNCFTSGHIARDGKGGLDTRKKGKINLASREVVI